MQNTTGSTTDRRTVVGVFDGPNHAEMALNELKNAGFSPNQVSVVAKDNRETRDMVESTGMGAEGATAGALLGGITGGILGWLVGIGALMIPGIGPVVAAGAPAATPRRAGPRAGGRGRLRAAGGAARGGGGGGAHGPAKGRAPPPPPPPHHAVRSDSWRAGDRPRGFAR